MKIGRRLMISYALLLLFLAAVMIVAVNRLDRLTQTTRDIVEGDAARAALAGAINLHAESAAGRLLLLFILEDREQRVAIYKEIDHHNAAIESTVEKMKPLLAGSEDGAALARIITLGKAYEEQFSATVEELEAGDRAVAMRRMSGATRTTLTALLAETATMAKKQQESMTLRQAHAAQAAQESKLVVVALGFGALFAGLLMAIVMTRGISRPLGTAVTAADRITSGDLNSAVPVGGRDEVGQLLGSMGNMRQRLRDVISTIHQSSGRVGHAAADLSQPASGVKSGSIEQSVLAGRIEQSVGHLTGGIGDMVAGAQATREQAQKARDMAQAGVQAIILAADEIARIAVTVAASAKSVESLGLSAQQVAETVNVIKEIADQTNLLALNASIEAARAGESGRGFAVVADEVRKLATRTAAATVQIDRVIASINAQTEVATRDIQAGRTGMERGMELIKSIVAPLGELRDGAQSSLESLETLTAVAEEQARESLAIAANVSEIVAMATANSHAAEAVAAITGELVELANGLQKTVDTFRL